VVTIDPSINFINIIIIIIIIIIDINPNSVVVCKLEGYYYYSLLNVILIWNDNQTSSQMEKYTLDSSNRSFYSSIYATFF